MPSPRIPPLPINYSPAPENWNIRPLTSFPAQSSKGIIQCLDTEIATNSDDALIMILTINYHTPQNIQGCRVKLVAGGTGVDTRVQPCEDGRVHLWGVVASQSIQDGLEVVLQIVYHDKVYDSIAVGRLHITGECASCPLSQPC